MIRRPPRSPLFPYTTLFRSRRHQPYAAVYAFAFALEALGRLAGQTRPPLITRYATWLMGREAAEGLQREGDRKSTRLNSSHVRISYAVFCLKKKKKRLTNPT